MRVDSRELPLSAIPLCQLLPCHLGPPTPTLSTTCMSKAVLTAPLEQSTCPIPAFRMRYRFSMPSQQVCSSLDLVVIRFCDLTLQICLIIALTFRCRHWRFKSLWLSQQKNLSDDKGHETCPIPDPCQVITNPLKLSALVKIFSRRHFEIFFHFP